jgi:hypothetical protein
METEQRGATDTAATPWRTRAASGATTVLGVTARVRFRRDRRGVIERIEVAAAALVPARRLAAAARAVATEHDRGAAAVVVYVGDAPVAAAAWMRGGDVATWTSRTDPGGVDDLAAAAAKPNPRDAAIGVFAAAMRRSVGERFFAAVRSGVARLRDGMTGVAADAVDARRALALQLVCRLLFLELVAPRGWFGGDVHFVKRLVMEPGAVDVYARRLRPLFFDGLNTPPSERRSGPIVAEVPYLNGGLFSPSPDEERWPDYDVPDALLVDLVDRLFVRFRFDGAEGAVDGAMLGTVFERLMSPEDRAATGTWYTPTALVEQLVQRGLREALAARLGADEADALLGGGTLDETAASRALAVLDAFRVLDPAVGSGAFAVAVAARLADLRVRASGAAGSSETPEVALRRVLRDSVHGVDVSAEAVGLCELRLWLALAARMPSGPSADLTPLPNLGHRIRRGDSLLSPWMSAWALGGEVPREVAAQMREAAARYSVSGGTEKGRWERQLKAHEARARCGALESARARAAARREELESALARPDLTGEIRPPTRAEARQLERARAAEREALALLAAEAATGSTAFDARLHYADVFAQGGFDLVIGNPPWVRLGALPASTRTALRTHYRWVADSGCGVAFGRQPDLAVAFVERATQLARHAGVVCLLVPSKLFSADYGAALRRELLGRHGVREVRWLHGSARGFRADVFPGALVVQVGQTTQKVLVGRDDGELVAVDGAALPLGSSPGAAWSPPGSVPAPRWEGCEELGALFRVRYGVKTGANGAFVAPPAGVGPVLPAVRGRDVRAFRVAGTVPLLFAHEPRTGRCMPSVDEATSTYLAGRPEVAQRSDRREGTPPWSLFRVHGECLGHRVVFRDIATQLEAVALGPVASGGPVALNTTYVVPVPNADVAQRLEAWLNAAPARGVAAALSDPALSGFRRFRLAGVSRVPVPLALLEPRGSPGVQRLVDAARAVALGEDGAQEVLDAAAWALVGGEGPCG